MALPTFFVIGAARAGTTSLHYYLSHSPRIHMSRIKETNFFSGPEGGIPYPNSRVATLEEYEALFDPAFQVRGEASPSYTVYPRRQGVPERIKALVPEARFVYLVRDPIARTVSHYMHRVAVEGERRSLSDALGDLSDPYCVYTCPSRYATQLKLYLAHFPLERFLVVDQADLLSNRRTVLREIFAFLSIEESCDSAVFEDTLGVSGRQRQYAPGWPAVREKIARSPLRTLPVKSRRRLRSLVERVLWPSLDTPELGEELHARLADLYRGEVDGLRQITGHRFPSWTL